MDPATFVSPIQFLTVALFLGVLGLVWAFVVRNKQGLARKINHGRRISVSEVSAISAHDRAIILRVDAQDYLVLKSKGSAPVVTRIEGAQP